MKTIYFGIVRKFKSIVNTEKDEWEASQVHNSTGISIPSLGLPGLNLHSNRGPLPPHGLCYNRVSLKAHQRLQAAHKAFPLVLAECLYPQGMS